MKLFGDAKVLRGSIAWTNPLRLKVNVLPAHSPPTPTVQGAQPVEEFDEDGRRYVFRYAAVTPQPRSVDRDRIFEYIKKHRLPDEGVRSYLRDLRNAGDFFDDVRDIQTLYEVKAEPPRLRAPLLLPDRVGDA